MLMPANPRFLEVFEIFMNEDQKLKIRANNVRQYIEGLIDLLLQEKICIYLKPSQVYEGLSDKKKLEILELHYDKSIATKFRRIYEIGGNGSHFNGKVSAEDLKEIIDLATHIVEDIFVKYFLEPAHRFGSENIYTIFSMLPLQNRIYILNQVYLNYQNSQIVDRLSLAYVKSGSKDLAIELLTNALQSGIIDKVFFNYQTEKINIIEKTLPTLYSLNAEYENNPNFSKALVVGDQLVFGLPTSQTIFDTAKAAECFKQWFEESKDEYPEFINLFLCLMATDNRQYI